MATKYYKSYEVTIYSGLFKFLNMIADEKKAQVGRSEPRICYNQIF